MIRARLAVAALFGWPIALAACGGGPAPGATRAESPATPRRASDSGGKAGRSSVVPAASDSARSSPARDNRWGDLGRAESDVEKWLASHGVKTPLPEGSDCEPAQIGNPPVDALLCHEPRQERAPAPRAGASGAEELAPQPAVVSYAVLWTVADKALRKALEVPIEAGPLDWVDNDPESNLYVRLVLTVGADGVSATVREDPKLGCERARAARKQLASSRETAALAPGLGRLVDRVCAARGRYVMRGGVFVRGGR